MSAYPAAVAIPIIVIKGIESGPEAIAAAQAGEHAPAAAAMKAAITINKEFKLI